MGSTLRAKLLVCLAVVFAAAVFIQDTAKAGINQVTGGGGGGSFASPGTGVIVDSGGGSLAARTMTSGDGIGVTNGNGAAGNPTFAVDSTVQRKGSGSGGPPNSCGNGGDTYQVGDIYTDTVTNTGYYCESGTMGGRWIPTNGGYGGLLLVDEFMSGNNTSGTIGDLGWTVSAIAGGSNLQTGTNANDATGVFAMAETTLNDGEAILLGSATMTNGFITGKDWTIQVRFKPTTTVANMGYTIGIGCANPATMSTCLGVRYYTANSDTTYIFVACSSATTGCQSAGDDVNQKVTASTKSPSAGTYSLFTMAHKNSGVGGASTYYMSIDNETAKTFCASGCDDTIATVPAGSLPFRITFIDLANQTAGIDIDYFRMAAVAFR